MATFKQFLLESEADAIELIDRRAADIRRFARQSGLDMTTEKTTLWRGASGVLGAVEWETRRDRRPLNTPRMMHEMADQFFYDKFGYRYRSGSVFATRVKSVAAAYGPVCAVIPLGDYEFCCSELIVDLYDNLIGNYSKSWFKTGPVAEMGLDELNRLLTSNGYGPTTFDDLRAAAASRVTAPDYPQTFRAISDDWIDYEADPDAAGRLLGLMKGLLERADYVESKTIKPAVDFAAEIMIKCDRHLLVAYGTPAYDRLMEIL